MRKISDGITMIKSFKMEHIWVRCQFSLFSKQFPQKWHGWLVLHSVLVQLLGLTNMGLIKVEEISFLLAMMIYRWNHG